MEKISILIVDDHLLLRESWAGILSSDHHFQVVAHTGDGLEAIRLAEKLRPRIILLDINMSPIDGFEVAAQLLKRDPQTRIIGLSVFSNGISIRRLLALGAMGYLTKNSSKEEMMHAIHEVSDGRQYLSEEARQEMAESNLEKDMAVSAAHSLSPREVEIVHHIRDGFSSREIAEQLHISTKTVEVHRYNILKKLHQKNSASLINFAFFTGI